MTQPANSYGIIGTATPLGKEMGILRSAGALGGGLWPTNGSEAGGLNIPTMVEFFFTLNTPAPLSALNYLWRVRDSNIVVSELYIANNTGGEHTDKIQFNSIGYNNNSIASTLQCTLPRNEWLHFYAKMTSFGGTTNLMQVGVGRMGRDIQGNPTTADVWPYGASTGSGYQNAFIVTQNQPGFKWTGIAPLSSGSGRHVQFGQRTSENSTDSQLYKHTGLLSDLRIWSGPRQNAEVEPDKFKLLRGRAGSADDVDAEFRAGLMNNFWLRESAGTPASGLVDQGWTALNPWTHFGGKDNANQTGLGGQEAHPYEIAPQSETYYINGVSQSLFESFTFGKFNLGHTVKNSPSGMQDVGVASDNDADFDVWYQAGGVNSKPTSVATVPPDDPADSFVDATFTVAESDEGEEGSFNTASDSGSAMRVGFDFTIPDSETYSHTLSSEAIDISGSTYNKDADESDHTATDSLEGVEGVLGSEGTRVVWGDKSPESAGSAATDDADDTRLTYDIADGRGSLDTVAATDDADDTVTVFDAGSVGSGTSAPLHVAYDGIIGTDTFVNALIAIGEDRLDPGSDVYEASDDADDTVFIFTRDIEDTDSEASSIADGDPEFSLDVVEEDADDTAEDAALVAGQMPVAEEDGDDEASDAATAFAVFLAPGDESEHAGSSDADHLFYAIPGGTAGLSDARTSEVVLDLQRQSFGDPADSRSASDVGDFDTAYAEPHESTHAAGDDLEVQATSFFSVSPSSPSVASEDDAEAHKVAPRSTASTRPSSDLVGTDAWAIFTLPEARSLNPGTALPAEASDLGDFEVWFGREHDDNQDASYDIADLDKITSADDESAEAAALTVVDLEWTGTRDFTSEDHDAYDIADAGLTAGTDVSEPPLTIEDEGDFTFIASLVGEPTGHTAQDEAGIERLIERQKEDLDDAATDLANARKRTWLIPEDGTGAGGTEPVVVAEDDGSMIIIWGENRGTGESADHSAETEVGINHLNAWYESPVDLGATGQSIASAVPNFARSPEDSGSTATSEATGDRFSSRDTEDGDSTASSIGSADAQFPVARTDTGDSGTYEFADVDTLFSRDLDDADNYAVDHLQVSTNTQHFLAPEDTTTSDALFVADESPVLFSREKADHSVANTYALLPKITGSIGNITDAGSTATDAALIPEVRFNRPVGSSVHHDDVDEFVIVDMVTNRNVESAGSTATDYIAIQHENLFTSDTGDSTATFELPEVRAIFPVASEPPGNFLVSDEDVTIFRHNFDLTGMESVHYLIPEEPDISISTNVSEESVHYLIPEEPDINTTMSISGESVHYFVPEPALVQFLDDMYLLDAVSMSTDAGIRVVWEIPPQLSFHDVQGEGGEVDPFYPVIEINAKSEHDEPITVASYGLAVLLQLIIDSDSGVPTKAWDLEALLGIEDIWNEALTLTGSETIDSVSDGSAEAEIISKVWDSVRQAFIADHTWNGGVTVATLSRQTDAAGDEVVAPTGFDYVYALPDDYLRAWRVNGDRFGAGEGVHWSVKMHKIDGTYTRVLYANPTAVDLEYIYDPADSLDGLSPLTKEALAYALAAKIAPRMGLSEGEIQGLVQRARLKLSDAKSADGQEGTPIFQPRTNLLTARDPGRNRRRTNG